MADLAGIEGHAAALRRHGNHRDVDVAVFALQRLCRGVLHLSRRGAVNDGSLRSADEREGIILVHVGFDFRVGLGRARQLQVGGARHVQGGGADDLAAHGLPLGVLHLGGAGELHAETVAGGVDGALKGDDGGVPEVQRRRAGLARRDVERLGGIAERQVGVRRLNAVVMIAVGNGQTARHGDGGLVRGGARYLEGLELAAVLNGRLDRAHFQIVALAQQAHLVGEGGVPVPGRRRGGGHGEVVAHDEVLTGQIDKLPSHRHGVRVFLGDIQRGVLHAVDVEAVARGVVVHLGIPSEIDRRLVDLNGVVRGAVVDDLEVVVFRAVNAHGGAVVGVDRAVRRLNRLRLRRCQRDAALVGGVDRPLRHRAAGGGHDGIVAERDLGALAADDQGRAVVAAARDGAAAAEVVAHVGDLAAVLRDDALRDAREDVPALEQQAAVHLRGGVARDSGGVQRDGGLSADDHTVVRAADRSGARRVAQADGGVRGVGGGALVLGIDAGAVAADVVVCQRDGAAVHGVQRRLRRVFRRGGGGGDGTAAVRRAGHGAAAALDAVLRAGEGVDRVERQCAVGGVHRRLLRARDGDVGHRHIGRVAQRRAVDDSADGVVGQADDGVARRHAVALPIGIGRLGGLFVADQIALGVAGQRTDQRDRGLGALRLAHSDNAVDVAVNIVGAQRDDGLAVARDLQRGGFPHILRRRVLSLRADVDRIRLGLRVGLLVHGEGDEIVVAVGVVHGDAAEAGGGHDVMVIHVARQLDGGAALLVGQGQLVAHAADEDQLVAVDRLARCLRGGADGQVAADVSLAGDAVVHAPQTDAGGRRGGVGVNVQRVAAVRVAGEPGVDLVAVLDLDGGVFERAGGALVVAVRADADAVLQHQLVVLGVQLGLDVQTALAVQSHAHVLDRKLLEPAAEGEVAFGIGFAALVAEERKRVGCAAVAGDLPRGGDVPNGRVPAERDRAGDAQERALRLDVAALGGDQRARLGGVHAARHRIRNLAVHGKGRAVGHLGVLRRAAAVQRHLRAVEGGELVHLAADVHVAVGGGDLAAAAGLRAGDVNRGGGAARMHPEVAVGNVDRARIAEGAEHMADGIAAVQRQRRGGVMPDDDRVTRVQRVGQRRFRADPCAANGRSACVGVFVVLQQIEEAARLLKGAADRHGAAGAGAVISRSLTSEIHLLAAVKVVKAQGRVRADDDGIAIGIGVLIGVRRVDGVARLIGDLAAVRHAQQIAVLPGQTVLAEHLTVLAENAAHKRHVAAGGHGQVTAVAAVDIMERAEVYLSLGADEGVAEQVNVGLALVGVGQRVILLIHAVPVAHGQHGVVERADLGDRRLPAALGVGVGVEVIGVAFQNPDDAFAAVKAFGILGEQHRRVARDEVFRLGRLHLIGNENVVDPQGGAHIVFNDRARRVALDLHQRPRLDREAVERDRIQFALLADAVDPVRLPRGVGRLAQIGRIVHARIRAVPGVCLGGVRRNTARSVVDRRVRRRHVTRRRERRDRAHADRHQNGDQHGQGFDQPCPLFHRDLSFCPKAVFRVGCQVPTIFV